ncbi:copper resistance protein B [Alkanindiges sp. WGS2144]|uniref:copper resistance protein B n=1 Tax=Alkanindiges sp. WGS2144 TaxID=3366808 RepID=UPI003750D31A
MHIIKQFIVAGVLSGSSMVHSAFALEQEIYSASYQKHLKEHGGQIYQATHLESEWLVDDQGQRSLESKLQSLIGSDENRLFVEANADKEEGSKASYNILALYSRNIAEFWDAQTGLRLSKSVAGHRHTDYVVGFMGLAPYFIETQAHMYAGKNQRWFVGLELERDFLLTQKLITQPYIEAELVLSDASEVARKTGLSMLKTGIQTRYEVNKTFRPFVDVGYHYEKGHKATLIQPVTQSEEGWFYSAGLAFYF